MAFWRNAGVDVLVSLIEDSEAAQLDLQGEEEAARAQGIEFLSFGIPDRGAPAATENTVVLLDHLHTSLQAGRTVAVHCRQGIGRAGMIAAGELICSGATPQAAIEAVSAVRGTEVPETAEQAEWLRRLPAVLTAAHPAQR